MNTLRVLLATTQALERPVPWALFDASGRAIDRGVGRRSAWPAAARTEAVLAASAVRIASITLPPLAPARVAAAAAFALDDQLAGPADAHHLAVSKQAPDGRVRVVIAAQRDVAALARSSDPLFSRIVAEPELAPPETGWRWCAGAQRSGFVRLPDGSAFPVEADAPDALPAELALALERARSDNAAPPRVVADNAATDAQLARWSREAGVPFSRGTPWQWDEAPADRFSAATDLLQGAFSVLPREAPTRALARALGPALALVVAAAILHVIAAVGDWTAANVDAWRQARAWSDLARAAGVPESDARDPASAKAAIAKRHAELRHAHGLVAPADALPLLARAAPAFGALSPDTVRGASYADGHWTFDLTRLDATTLARLDDALRNAGTPALAATNDSGTRVRIGAP